MLGIVFKGTAIPIYWMLLDKRLKEQIRFHIRIKNNTITPNAKGLKVDIDGLCYGLKPKEQRCLKGRKEVCSNQPG